MSKPGAFFPRIFLAFLALVPASLTTSAQQAAPTAKDSKPASTEKNPAQIELLETKYRFASNGDSRKEVHARVRINNELGARQFARLNFDFNRSFQSVEIPLIRVTHTSGGTTDILPSAVTDNPNPAVADYPAYHEVRVKSVRILGLQTDDLLEYRVITSTTRHPLAPDFWLDHTFDRSGVVSEERFELDLPKLDKLTIRINPATPQSSLESSGEAPESRVVYRWQRHNPSGVAKESENPGTEPDVSLTTFASWEALANRIAAPLATEAPGQEKMETELVYGPSHDKSPAESIYYFVSQKIRTVDLPLGATEFRVRDPREILESGYGTREDKFVLFNSLFRLTHEWFLPVLVCGTSQPERQLPRPSLFESLLVQTGKPQATYSDLSLEVAPFGAIPSRLRGSRGLQVIQLFQGDANWWTTVSADLPFSSTQHVIVDSAIAKDGSLHARVKYTLRGDNELLLRVAFHKAEREKWKDVAQMLALSDGFRGQIVNVTASDPYATKQPFTVEYELSQPKFVDWSKKSLRIPAILPLPGLPDAPGAEQIAAKKPIELGTPLAIELEATIELPAGATAQAPIGTAVNRDYATFTAKYSVQEHTLHASRSLHFLSSVLPASRATDFTAFLHAVQSDQAQLFNVVPAPQK